jgi:hypothetical protein
MQQQNPPPVVSSRKVAFRYGLIFGLIQAAIAIVVSLLSKFVLSSNTGVTLVLNGIVFLIGLTAYFIAGMLASRQTGKVSTGTISGLWTGVFSGILGCIVNVVLFLSITYPTLIDHYNKVGYPSNVSQSAFKVGAIAGGVGIYILGFIFAIGVGAGIGALGGLLGRSQARKNAPPQPYPGQPYPGQPYPGQPYPGQPYPPQPYPNQASQGQSYPGQPYPYTQPHPGQQASPSNQSTTPSPTEWNPYSSDQPYSN